MKRTGLCLCACLETEADRYRQTKLIWSICYLAVQFVLTASQAINTPYREVKWVETLNTIITVVAIAIYSILLRTPRSTRADRIMLSMPLLLVVPLILRLALPLGFIYLGRKSVLITGPESLIEMKFENGFEAMIEIFGLYGLITAEVFGLLNGVVVGLETTRQLKIAPRFVVQIEASLLLVIGLLKLSSLYLFGQLLAFLHPIVPFVILVFYLIPIVGVINRWWKILPILYRAAVIFITIFGVYMFFDIIESALGVDTTELQDSLIGILINLLFAPIAGYTVKLASIELAILTLSTTGTVATSKDKDDEVSLREVVVSDVEFKPLS